MIQFIRNREIDREKWDHCITKAPNGLIYALSWYLDVVSPGWSALVAGDYEQVMPLPVSSRMGISYAYTPYYAQQLGVFGPGIDEKCIRDFLKKIPASVRLADIKMNEGNQPGEGDYVLRLKNNHLLSLEASYEEISTGYTRNCKRNLKKAQEAGLSPSGPVDAAEFSRFVYSGLEAQMEGLGKSAVNLLEEITRAVVGRKCGEVVTVRDAGGAICAAGSFLFSGDRLIFSVCASSEEGKKHQAMYMLVDSQIHRYTGRFRIFDFSGSDIKGIAYFNTTFGAEPVSYPLLHMNRLNLVQRILSRKFR
ncbi:MAG: hypothetical protein JW801_10555 [Bacteroidales bacterium]|nr:hypothetical protein [Bacteroidales bacterium]